MSLQVRPGYINPWTTMTSTKQGHTLLGKNSPADKAAELQTKQQLGYHNVSIRCIIIVSTMLILQKPSCPIYFCELAYTLSLSIGQHKFCMINRAKLWTRTYLDAGI